MRVYIDTRECPSGRICHRTKSEAKRALKATKRTNQESGSTMKVEGLHISKCRQCSHWHVTAREAGRI